MFFDSIAQCVESRKSIVELTSLRGVGRLTNVGTAARRFGIESHDGAEQEIDNCDNMPPNKSLHWPPDVSVTALAKATAAPDTGSK